MLIVLVNLIIVGLITGTIVWLIGIIPCPPMLPWIAQIIKALVILFAVIYVLQLLIGMLPGNGFGGPLYLYNPRVR